MHIGVHFTALAVLAVLASSTWVSHELSIARASCERRLVVPRVIWESLPGLEEREG